MTNAVETLYEQTIRILPPSERLRLATLILNELVDDASEAIDHSDTWTEQDQLDLVTFSLQAAASDPYGLQS